MSKINNNENKLIIKLDSNFITGLTESEGSFSVSVYKDNRAKFKRNVALRYKITMLKNEIELLKMVESFFGCGVLSQNEDGTVDFAIRDYYSIKNILIPHFLKCPLMGTKHLDFMSFKGAFDIINNKEHLMEEGLNKIYKISKTMNTYRKFLESDCYSPNYDLEKNINFKPLNGHYVNGFIAGDGCLALSLRNKSFGKMSLQISQHINNKLLLICIANYFKSPSKVYPHGPKSLQISLNGIKLWENVIFPHFSKYPLYGTKKLRLNKLFIVRRLILNNEHLVQIGKYRQWKPDYKLCIKDI
jgi:hypothetical protein